MRISYTGFENKLYWLWESVVLVVRISYAGFENKLYWFWESVVLVVRISCTGCEKKSFADTKGIIRNCKLKDRQYNGQKEKDKRTKNDPQNTTENKDWGTRIYLTKKRGCTQMIRNGQRCSCSSSNTGRVTEYVLVASCTDRGGSRR